MGVDIFKQCLYGSENKAFNKLGYLAKEDHALGLAIIAAKRRPIDRVTKRAMLILGRFIDCLSEQQGQGLLNHLLSENKTFIDYSRFQLLCSLYDGNKETVRIIDNIAQSYTEEICEEPPNLVLMSGIETVGKHGYIEPWRFCSKILFKAKFAQDNDKNNTQLTAPTALFSICIKKITNLFKRKIKPTRCLTRFNQIEDYLNGQSRLFSKDQRKTFSEHKEKIKNTQHYETINSLITL